MVQARFGTYKLRLLQLYCRVLLICRFLES
jgi:hypothetical protein